MKNALILIILLLPVSKVKAGTTFDSAKNNALKVEVNYLLYHTLHIGHELFISENTSLDISSGLAWHYAYRTPRNTTNNTIRGTFLEVGINRYFGEKWQLNGAFSASYARHKSNLLVNTYFGNYEQTFKGDYFYYGFKLSLAKHVPFNSRFNLFAGPQLRVYSRQMSFPSSYYIPGVGKVLNRNFGTAAFSFGFTVKFRFIY